MDYLKNNLADFTHDLSSLDISPGGGSASALAGAVGIALGAMVGQISSNRSKSAPAIEELDDLVMRSETLRECLLSCVDRDAKNLETLANAYTVPNDDPNKDEIMEQALKQAVSVPLQIFNLSCESIKLLKDIIKKGRIFVSSDASAGAAICRGALCGAAILVLVNTKQIKDREFAENINKHINLELNNYIKESDALFEEALKKYE